jgi:transposase
MIQMTFTEAERAAFNDERYHHPDPRVQRKMEIMWLKSCDLSTAEIARLAVACPNTVRQCFHEYAAGGLERLKTMNYYQPQSELAAHTTTLQEHFEKHPPATVKEAMHEIEELTGIHRSETQVRAFMKKIGLKCRKVGMLPAKADPEVQATYLHTDMEPRLAEAQAGHRAVFFVDAAHFVLAPFLGFL